MIIYIIIIIIFLLFLYKFREGCSASWQCVNGQRCINGTCRGANLPPHEEPKIFCGGRVSCPSGSVCGVDRVCHSI